MTSGSGKQGDHRVWHPIEDIRSLAASGAGDHNFALTESPSGFTVTVELPEARKKDLHLNVAETSVTIFAQWANRVYSRVVQLPAPVMTDEARATFKDRVLRIVLRRAKPSQVRRIEVK